MPQEKMQIKHRYLFTQKELKELLSLEGDLIIEVGVWAGLSPNDEKNHVSTDKVVYYITTQEGDIEPGKW
jgi:hypothetical protein